MSKFGVTVEQLEKIEPHENADRLEMATLSGRDYSFVVGKGQFQAGDAVIYFPIDSLLPMKIVHKIGLTGKLAHGNIPDDDSERLQNRVKTVKLRGNISQGIVTGLTDLADIYPDIDFESLDIGDDITEALGVTKYEPPVLPMRHGSLAHLPDMVSTYDIESAQNYRDIMDEYLMDRLVYITEKVEGSNWWATIDADGKIRVGQRNYEIIDVEDYQHDWYKVLKSQQLEDKLRQLWDELDKSNDKLQLVTLRGEMTGPGVQGNYYKLKDYKVWAFDIEVNGQPIDARQFLELTERLQIDVAPELAVNVTLRDWLNGKSIKEMADRQSQIHTVKREGIVIKPMTEQTDMRLGRVFIKQHSLAYLAKSKL